MNDRTKIAVLKAGIVPTESLPELERWGLKVPEDLSVDENKRNALDNIRESIESKETVELRQTDLDALRTYSENQKVGRLYYAAPGPLDVHSYGEKPKKSSVTYAKVTYAVTPAGLYLIPWTGEDIYDVMIDEDTYLKLDGEERVYFIEVTDLYYGEHKAFMVCKPLVRK